MQRRASLVTATLTVLAAGCSEEGTRSYRIPSSAMEPTLHCARPAAGCTADEMDRVRVRPDSTLERGDIIVFMAPRRAVVACSFPLADDDAVYVKRVIGLPGETWAAKDGFVYINGRRLKEEYIEKQRRDVETTSPRKIPAGTYVVLGDFRSSSCDSRRWGPLAKKNIIGRVVEIIRGDETIELD